MVLQTYGAHIDWGCERVVIQYNLSKNNYGGFAEILGENIMCGYRYNISIVMEEEQTPILEGLLGF